MSQMLPTAGGQAPSAGYTTYGNDGTTQNSIGPGTQSLPQTQPSYSLSPVQQQQQQLLQRQQLQQLQQQQMQQQQQQLQLQQALQMGGQAASGTPILGSGGTPYRTHGGRRVQAQVPKYTELLNKVRITASVKEEEKVGRAVTQSDSIPPLTEAGSSDSDTCNGEDEKENANLANNKEKTPMCLVNELARYNKVTHQYSLVDEQGPAHKKTFFVKLELGGEVYEAKGESIKKAQHAAAAIALVETKHSRPVPKSPKFIDAAAANVTPTVELNALAMKRGEPAIYKTIDTKPSQPANLDFRGVYNQRYHYGGNKPRPFFVMLKVGTREFLGEGVTRQTARHNAAQKALKVLQNLPMPAERAKPKPEDEEKDEGDGDEDAMKSEISLVHEIALKRSLSVAFEVVRESGPPHMKTFVTKCIVGDLTTEAEGNSKKLSKKRAAEFMLDELKKLPSIPTVTLKPKLKQPNNKKKNRNIIKVQKADPSYGVGVNPISRLIQIMQASRKKEPVYTLVEEKGLARRREFIMRCQVDEQMADGVGPNKKLAKRNAAEAMLQLLGYSRPSPQPSKPAIKSSSSSSEGVSSSDKKVTFVENTKPPNGMSEPSRMHSAGCQVVPGLLRLNHSSAASVPGLMVSAHPPQPTFADKADGVRAVLAKTEHDVGIKVTEVAKFLQIPCSFEEFTKQGSGSIEFITRVTLGLPTPQKFHGSGSTSEIAKNHAGLATLQYLLAISHQSNAPGKGAGDVASPMKTEPPTLLRQLNSAGDAV